MTLNQSLEEKKLSWENLSFTKKGKSRETARKYRIHV